MLNVLPNSAGANCPNQTWSYAIFSCNHFWRQRTGSNFENLNTVQFCKFVCFAAKRIKATLVDAVIFIILVGSLKKMIWIHARRIVAMVADKLCRIKTSKVKNIGKPVSFRCFAINVENAISRFNFPSKPYPACPQFWAMLWDWAILIKSLSESLLCALESLVVGNFRQIHKQKRHRPMKVLSARMEPQTPDDGGNVLSSRAFTATTEPI